MAKTIDETAKSMRGLSRRQRIDAAVDGAVRPATTPHMPATSRLSQGLQRRRTTPMTSMPSAGIEVRDGVAIMDPPRDSVQQQMQLNAMEKAGGIPEGSAFNPSLDARLKRRRRGM